MTVSNEELIEITDRIGERLSAVITDTMDEFDQRQMPMVDGWASLITAVELTLITLLITASKAKGGTPLKALVDAAKKILDESFDIAASIPEKEDA